MPRTKDVPKDCPQKPDTFRGSGTVRKEYLVQLITPMFGGGVQPQTIDIDFPVRPTEIRGQLEFWWRATAGAQYNDAKALRQKQDAIWGSTKCASKVVVIVELLTTSMQIQPCAVFEKDHTNPQKYRSMPTWKPPFDKGSFAYVLFPFQGKLDKSRTTIHVQPAQCLCSLKFKLVIECPEDVWRDVEPALWAWANFGGLGSRTRRGCGAIYCHAFAPADEDELVRRFNEYVHSGTAVRDWPTLAECVLIGDVQNDAIGAWDKVIKLLRDFRQAVNVGRNPGSQVSRPGRSRWPEPETIRSITGRRSQRHARQKDIPDNAFPRAEFGLPIVFHFKDKGHGDPQDTTLYPAGDYERMASPLILRPVALKGQQRSLPVIVRLKTQVVDKVELHDNDGKQKLPIPGAILIRDPKLAQYRDSPLASRSGQGSALEAFVTYAQKNGFRRIV